MQAKHTFWVYKNNLIKGKEAQNEISAAPHTTIVFSAGRRAGQRRDCRVAEHEGFGEVMEFSRGGIEDQIMVGSKRTVLMFSKRFFTIAAIRNDKSQGGAMQKRHGLSLTPILLGVKHA